MNIVKTIGAILNLISYISPSYAAKKALNLFATPRKGRVTDAEIPFLDTAFKKEVTYQDLEIMTYRWPGKNKTVLLAHGWESNSSRWSFLVKQLKPFDYNIVAIDAPAHGNSCGNQFNAILYSECINVVVNTFKPKIIIGHSVGGMASVFFQNKYQFTGLEKLILLGAPAHFEGVFKRYADMLGYNSKIREGLDKLVLKRFNQLPSYFSAARFSETISTKGLIIHDKHDKIIPFEDALLYQKHYANAELIETKGLGHGLKGEKITKIIIQFINS